MAVNPIIDEAAARITPLFALELVRLPHNPWLAFWRVLLVFTEPPMGVSMKPHRAWSYAHQIEARVLSRYHDAPRLCNDSR